MFFLGVGWYLTFLQVRHQLASRVEIDVLERNAQVVERIASTIDKTATRPIQFGSREWERVQQQIENIVLPAEAFACIVDRDGFILCHPQIRSNPGLRELNMGTRRFEFADGPDVALVADLGDGVSRGRMSFFLDGTHYVATKPLANLDARLLVHQPESGLVQMGEMATTGIGIASTVSLVAAIGLTAFVTFFILKRHDNALERVDTGLEEEVNRRLNQSLQTRHALILGLAKLADHRDTETGAHLDRICSYSAMLAEHLRPRFDEIDDDWIECLRLAASLHDIGKVGIRDQILLKPGKLSDEERAIMERHTIIGAETLRSVMDRLDDDPLIRMGVDIVIGHHERWDGTGYPNGVAGESIPLAARIVAIADVYDALTSKRVYKPAMSHDDAVSIIRQGRATQFDPVVTDAFLEIVEQFDVVRHAMHASDPDPTHHAIAA